MPGVEIWYDPSGAAALYADRQLKFFGEATKVHEQAAEFFGVKRVFDDAYLLGGTTPAQTLTEVAEYKEQREDRDEQIAQLEAQAAELLKQAEELRRKKDAEPVPS
jgi:hypothetical protein